MAGAEMPVELWRQRDAMAFDDGGDAAATTVGDGVYMVLTV